MTAKRVKDEVVEHEITSFMNNEAQARFEVLKSKPVIFERGFRIEARQCSTVYVQQIQKQGWSSFCHPRTEAILRWVHEFYANAGFHNNGKTFVRGKEIDFSEEAINQCFDLPQLKIDDFNNFKTSIPPIDVASTLCLSSKITWANAAKHVLSSATFSREAKVWLLFINASILPTKHLNHVSSERALLIYCILQGASINVGRIISDQIKQKAKTDGGRQLWYPTLITALCRVAGVNCVDTDTTTLVGRPITHTVISSYIKVQSEDPPAKSATKSPKSAKQPTTPPSDTASIMEYLNYITKFQRAHHRYVDAYLDILHSNQLKFLQHAQIPVGTQAFPFVNPIDAEGYLTSSKGKRLPPFEDKEPDSESDDDDDEV